ncbi:hypothetical protein A2U01_0113887, partial [Trifolium medium]|nr:hypothetical protein [Trifolium medium]
MANPVMVAKRTLARVGDQAQNISQFWSLSEDWRPG